MAERRMFAKTIIDSDAFLDMPLSTQALYFHLSMRADDDGFINNPRKIQRMTGASDDDLRLLNAKKFIIPFDSGVVVIKHWKIHNYIQSDRYKETVYKEEKAQLRLKENNAYTLDTECIQDVSNMDTKRIQDVSITDTDSIQDVSKADTQVRLGKNRIDKNSIVEGSVVEVEQPEPPTEPTTFTPPTKEEIINYCKPLGLTFDIDRFYDFYSSNGWMVRGRKMRDWQAACRYWASTEYKKKGGDQNANMKTHDWDYDKIEEQASQLSEDWLEKIKKRAGMT